MTATTNPRTTGTIAARTTANASTRRAMFSSATDQWPTPADFFATLDAEFGFVLDVCADAANRKAEHYFGLDHNDSARRDGLAGDWAGDATDLDGSAWMNPPYGRGIDAWMAKAAATARAGATVVALVPVRADAAWWHEHVLAAGAEVRYVRGRLKFGAATTSAPFASAVVIYRPGDIAGVPGPVSAIDRTGTPLFASATAAVTEVATVEPSDHGTPAPAPSTRVKNLSERPTHAHSPATDAMLELLFGTTSAGLTDATVTPTPAARRTRRVPAHRPAESRPAQDLLQRLEGGIVQVDHPIEHTVEQRRAAMTDVSPYNQHLAGHTALVIAALHSVHGAPADGSWPVADVLRVTAELARKHKLGVTGSRHVAARQHIACYTAVYARRFHPGTGRSLATAPDKATGRLIWAGPDGHVTVDALDCGNATSPLLTDDGAGLLAAAGLGALVRVIRLAAPHTSRRWAAGRWQPLTGENEPAPPRIDRWHLAGARAAS